MKYQLNTYMDKERIVEMPADQIRELALSGDIILVTDVGAAALEQVIENKKAEIAAEQRAMGQAAADDPDLPENTTFKEIKTRLQFELPRQLNELREKQDKAIVYSEANTSQIGFGTVFEADMYYLDVDEKESERFILLGPVEAMYMKDQFPGLVVISYLSPIGRGLWGKAYHDQATHQIETPSGNIKCVIKRRDV